MSHYKFLNADLLLQYLVFEMCGYCESNFQGKKETVAIIICTIVKKYKLYELQT